MPFMNGIELIERVRKLPAHASTPAIMLTAFRKGLFGAHSAGFDVIMQKPLDIDSLAHGIAHLIARRRSGNQ
jgi:CheY-like chemotaxis protein